MVFSGARSDDQQKRHSPGLSSLQGGSGDTSIKIKHCFKNITKRLWQEYKK